MRSGSSLVSSVVSARLSPGNGRNHWLLAAGAVLAVAAAFVAKAALATDRDSPTADPTRPAPNLAADAEPETIVMLHGLARGPRSMTILADRLEASGYRVIMLGYPSTQAEPAALVSHVRDEIAQCCVEAAPLHFVTYSLGSLLLRAMLAEEAPAGLGRVVMLGPPNQGSELVDEFGAWSVFRLLGPTAAQLGTGAESFPGRLGAADFEVGIIAGTRGNPVGNAIIPGDSDGTVGVERARLEGMDDFITVEHSHTFLMRSERVAAETVHFLQNGRFSADASRPEGDE